MTDAATPTPNLLDRYLEGLASEADLPELSRRMREDPAFAEEFAQACRLEACLSEWFRTSKTVVDIGAALSLTGKIGTVTDFGQGPADAPHVSTKSVTVPIFPPARTAGRRRRFGLAAAAVAVVAAVLTAAFWPRDSRTTPVAPAITGDVLAGSVLADNTQVHQVRAGVEVRTAGDVPAVVRLSDGSEAHLQPGAAASFRGRTDKLRQQVELRQGSIHFEVSKGQGPFVVTTSLGDVTALGTAFTVGLLGQGPYAKGAETMTFKHVVLAVTVLSGAVQVNFGGKDYRLGPGDDCLFAADAEKGPKINVVSGKLTKVESGSVAIAGQGKSGEVTKDVSLDSATKVLVQTGEMESVAVPAKDGAEGGTAERPKVRDGTAADLVVGKKVTAKVDSEGKALEILVLSPRLKIGTVSGELTKFEADSVTITSTGQGKNGEPTQNVRTAELDSETKVLIETDEMESVEAKGGTVERAKIREGSTADLVVGKKVRVRIDSDGKAVDILVPRPVPAKGGNESGAKESGVKEPTTKASGAKEPTPKASGAKESGAK